MDIRIIWFFMDVYGLMKHMCLTVLFFMKMGSRRNVDYPTICFVLLFAIDTFGNSYAEICGHGRPSSTRIYKT